MAVPLDPETGLARAFAEYGLLPDLLALNANGTGSVESWAALLDREGFAMDHVDNDHLPEGIERERVMALDAWRVAEWLELAQEGGLTDAGRAVAAVADYGAGERTQAVWLPAEEVIAEQMKTCYRGAGGIAIVDLVQEAARALAGSEDEWTRICPGLLPVEFEALVNVAHADAQAAIRLPSELAGHRREAMRNSPAPLNDTDELENMLFHADMLAGYYLRALPGHLNEDVLTLTAVQATLILFVLCGLLRCPKPHLPVQYMVVPNA